VSVRCHYYIDVFQITEFFDELTISNHERAIRRDALVKQFHLSERQARAIEHILEHGGLTILAFERLCPDVNRRTLQRDLKSLVDKDLLFAKGATNQLEYRLKA